MSKPRQFNFAFCYEMEGYLKALRDHCPERFDYGQLFQVKLENKRCGCLAGMMYCNKKDHADKPIEEIAQVWGFDARNGSLNVNGVEMDGSYGLQSDKKVVRQVSQWLGCTIQEAKDLYMGFRPVTNDDDASLITGVSGINMALANLRNLRLKYTPKRKVK